MAGLTPKERFDAGFKIGTLSAPTRPLQSADLIFVQDVSEAAALESVRVATVGDLFADMSGGATGLTKSITVNTAAEGMININFVNGILVSYTSANGTGTIDDPYLVSTATQLDNVRNDLAAYYKLIADIDLTSYQANEGWVPIGHVSDKPFTGVFDGAGYKITGLVSAPSTGVSGLFGELLGATIQDLEIEAGAVTSADNYAGLLFGRSYTSTISGCVVSGTVEGYSSSGGLGGIMNGGTITECGADVDVTGTGAAQIGGLTGYFNGTMTKCYALGDVLGVGGNAGGLVGTLGAVATIADSYAQGDVSATTSAASGGLVGSTNTITEDITNCYSSGAVTNGAANGGLVGLDGAPTPPFPDPVLDSCVWDKTINSGLSTSNFGSVAETTANMWKAETYTALAWDFTAGTGIWAIVADTSYPTLQWQA